METSFESGLSRRTFVKAAGAAVGLAAIGPRWLLGARAGATGPMYVPAEDVALERMWMAWPSSTTIWGTQLLPRIQGDIATLAREIAKTVPVVMCATSATQATKARTQCGPTVPVISTIPVNDCWMRDSGPLFRVDGAGARDAFGLNFNGWGKKQAHRKDRLVASRVATYAGVTPFATASVVGEGGGVEWDGDGTLMATESCWVNANRNPGKTRAQIETELLARFGATKMIWVSPGIRGQDLTDDHVDSTSRFVRPGVVMVQLPTPDRTDVWAQDARLQHQTLANAVDARGRSLQVITVQGPTTLPRWPTSRWDTFLDSYVNWVVAGNTVITAQFGDVVADAAAKAAIELAFPGKTCVQLNLDQLHGEGGGGAHCVTMQQPAA